VATKNSAAGTSAVEETANRIRELNEKLIQLAKESGQSSLDTYEKALQSLVDFEKSVATANSIGSPAWRTLMRSSSRTSPASTSRRPAKP
jgi:hypothetical protein